MSKFSLVFIVLALWVFAVVDCKSSKNAPTPAPSRNCNDLVLNMVDCLSYVSNGSTVIKPQGTCCAGLKLVLKTDAECLCEAFKNIAHYGISVNMTKANTLPAACGVHGPSISDCGSSPTPSPPPGPSSPSAIAPSPESLVRAPAPAPEVSGASRVLFSFAALIVSLVMVGSSTYF